MCYISVGCFLIITYIDGYKKYTALAFMIYFLCQRPNLTFKKWENVQEYVDAWPFVIRPRINRNIISGVVRSKKFQWTFIGNYGRGITQWEKGNSTRRHVGGKKIIQLLFKNDK